MRGVSPSWINLHAIAGVLYWEWMTHGICNKMLQQHVILQSSLAVNQSCCPPEYISCPLSHAWWPFHPTISHLWLLNIYSHCLGVLSPPQKDCLYFWESPWNCGCLLELHKLWHLHLDTRNGGKDECFAHVCKWRNCNLQQNKASWNVCVDLKSPVILYPLKKMTTWKYESVGCLCLYLAGCLFTSPTHLEQYIEFTNLTQKDIKDRAIE